ncbi:hypothetical protein CHUAL_002574 [Chamberlinius hualienensis]
MELVEEKFSCDLSLQIHPNCDETLQNQSVIHRPPTSQLEDLEVTNLAQSGTASKIHSPSGHERGSEIRRESAWKSVTKDELFDKSLGELKFVLDDLTKVVEDVSSHLVCLLEERQNLQEEVDFRNIAIEQLWKVQGKLQWKLTEPQLGIQMSVVFPADNSETVNCQ